MGSALLSFFQELNANAAAEKLKERLSFQTNVHRDEKTDSIASEPIIPFDVILLSAVTRNPSATTNDTSIPTENSFNSPVPWRSMMPAGRR